MIRTHTHNARRGGFLQGCLIGLAILVVILIAGGIYVAMNFKTWVTDGAVSLTNAAIDSADLPENEKPELKAIITSVGDEVKDGTISLEQVGTIFESFMDGVVFNVGATQVIETGYLPASTLDEETKADGVIQLRRLASGVADGSISQSTFNDTLSSIATIDPESELLDIRSKDQVTDDDLVALIDAARAAADEAGVSAETELIDLSDLLQAQVDEALGRSSASDAGDSGDSGEASEPTESG